MKKNYHNYEESNIYDQEYYTDLVNDIGLPDVRITQLKNMRGEPIMVNIGRTIGKVFTQHDKLMKYLIENFEEHFINHNRKITLNEILENNL